MGNDLALTPVHEARELTPLEVDGRIVVKSIREIKFLRDVIRVGTLEAAKRHGIHRQTAWRYLNKRRNRKWMKNEMEKAAATMAIDFGWVMREFKKMVEGKRAGNKVVVECLRNMAKMIGAFKNTNLNVNYDVELRFEGEGGGNGKGSFSDTIETSCEPSKSSQQPS